MTEQEQELYMKYLARHVLLKQLQQLKSELSTTTNSSFIYLEHETLTQLIPPIMHILNNANTQAFTPNQNDDDLKDISEECESFLRPIQQEFEQLKIQLDKLVNK